MSNRLRHATCPCGRPKRRPHAMFERLSIILVAALITGCAAADDSTSDESSEDAPSEEDTVAESSAAVRTGFSICLYGPGAASSRKYSCFDDLKPGKVVLSPGLSRAQC